MSSSALLGADALPAARVATWVAAVQWEPWSASAFDFVPICGAASVSRTADCTAVFDGELYNRQDLVALPGATADMSDADLIGLAYGRWGVDLPRHIKGIFSIVVVDARGRQILAVRDPLGAYPLYFTEATGRLLISTSIDALRAQADVDRSVNRAALADHLCHRWPDPHETFFAAIRRVPPGYMFRSIGRSISVTRYWEPVPADQPVSWIAGDELQDRFDRSFEQAVARALEHGPSGVFLSGGLDSISVGAMAADVARRSNRPLPVALSLGFPDDSDEEFGQRGVARSLGIDHEFVPFADAAPMSGLLGAALAVSRTRPAPLINTWAPAYMDLARRGKRRGVTAILSGAGGDEWMAVSPCLATDLMQTGDVRGLTRLIWAWRRSYKMSVPSVARCLLWRFGLRPLASSMLDRMAPGAWRANRVARSMRGTLPWVAPDAALSRELAARIERWLPPVTPDRSFYFQDVRACLEHPLTSMELEEIFETGRSLDVRFLHPFWDAEIVDILYRTPPLLLFAGGRSKSVVRQTMAARFDGLGLDRQKKVAATTFYRSVLDREMPGMWRRHHDFTALSDLGIVEPRAVTAMAERQFASGTGADLVRIWDLMNLETWVRAHQ